MRTRGRVRLSITLTPLTQSGSQELLSKKIMAQEISIADNIAMSQFKACTTFPGYRQSLHRL